MRQTFGSRCAWRPTALHRLAKVASPNPRPLSSRELGMRLPEVTTMMNAEWPTLLKFTGQSAANGMHYLCVEEVQTLVRTRRLRGTVVKQLGAGHAGV